MKGKGSDFFWPSFTDLMTSLFFIMLVLYVLTYLKLTNQQKATEQQLNKIKEIQAAVKELPKEYFQYDSVYKRFSLVQNVEFEKGKDIIKPKDEQYLVKVGNSIRGLIDNLKSKYAQQDIKYVVIIEGMASNDNFSDNFPLSYKRAWAVLKLWQEKRPLAHISSGKDFYNDKKHNDFILEEDIVKFKKYFYQFDIEIEAKQKEIAILKIKDFFNQL